MEPRDVLVVSLDRFGIEWSPSLIQKYREDAEFHHVVNALARGHPAESILRKLLDADSGGIYPAEWEGAPELRSEYLRASLTTTEAEYVEKLRQGL